jgi:hypothetical protein
MSLADAYVQCYGQIPDLFQKISQGQAPAQFTQQHLKDIGLTSASHRAFIPLLKTLGFLSQEGQPTQRYQAYRDQSQAKRVMAEALKGAYGDIFVIKEKPTKADREVIEGKFKSAHNTSDRMATLMANTFFALLDLADLDTLADTTRTEPEKKGMDSVPKPTIEKGADHIEEKAEKPMHIPGLHYDIQIHLPATKDIEVYNAIFKSLKEHLFES